MKGHRSFANCCRFAVALWFVAAPVVADVSDDEKRSLRARITVLGEYDDNVNLASGTGPDETEVDDYVVRVQPEVILEKAFDEHVLRLSLSGDVREGMDTPLSEANFGALGLLHFSFPGGVHVRLHDSFQITEFDQAVFFAGNSLGNLEAGVSTTTSNRAGVALLYQPRERLAFSGIYERHDEKYDFSSGETDEKRDGNRLEGGVTLPLMKSVAVYGNVLYGERRSAERPSYENDDLKLVGGLDFKGERFRLFAESGKQTIDFLDTIGDDFDEMIVRVGVEASLTDRTRFSLSGGRDGFGEAAFEGTFAYVVEDARVALVARRSTEPSFSRATAGRTFTATLVGGDARRDFGRWEGSLGASYFLLDSTSGGVESQDKTTVFNAALTYEIRRWMRIGGQVRYAKRDAATAVNGFTSNRAGLSVILVY